MSDDTPREETEAPPAPAPKTAVGRLRPHPSAPSTRWTPEEEAAEPRPRPEAGTLEQRADTRRREGLRQATGIPEGQAAGWILFIVGGLVYLHAMWATANAALSDGRDAEQIVSFAGLEFLEGTLGIVLMFLGLVLALVFTFVPVRHVPRLVPGTLEFEVAAENVLRMRDRRRILIWSGVAVFVIGLALAAYPLKASIAAGELWRVSLGGNAYRIHFWGYLLAAVGIAISVPFLVVQAGSEQAAAVVAGVLPDGRVRRSGATRRGPATEGAPTEEEPTAGRPDEIKGWTGPPEGAGAEPPRGQRPE